MTSVFRDRSEILKKLNSNIFEKDILLYKNNNIVIFIKILLTLLIKYFIIKNAKIDNIFNIINNLRKFNYDIVIYRLLEWIF